MAGHEMIVLGQVGSSFEAECLDCGRHLIVGPGRFHVVAQGDFDACHSFSVGVDLDLRPGFG